MHDLLILKRIFKSNVDLQNQIHLKFNEKIDNNRDLEIYHLHNDKTVNYDKLFIDESLIPTPTITSHCDNNLIIEKTNTKVLHEEDLHKYHGCTR